MEVIKYGQLPSEKRYIATCGNCGTKFSFKRGEAKCEGSTDPRDGTRVLTVHCPLEGCGRACHVCG